MKTMKELTHWFTCQGGTRYRFSQSTFLKDNPTVTTIRYKKDKTENRVMHDVHSGICAALSLRFVEGRIVGLDAPHVLELIESALPIAAVQQTMIASHTKCGKEAAGIKGVLIQERTPNFSIQAAAGPAGAGALAALIVSCAFVRPRSDRPFASRVELVTFLQYNRGLYKYETNKHASPIGHAVAFDTRDDRFWFFDANTGIWYRPKKFTSERQLYDFIYNYWEIIKYKEMFEGGARHMYQFA
jgi:hypothetical protein